MQIILGERIRELRKRDGRTQEELANALGVTNQAVSRWEANGGFPDMTLIPSIANYFHVTIDELFGYNGEREQRINDITAKADLLLDTHGGDNEEAIAFLRDAAKEFPSDSEILFRLGSALALQIVFKKGIKVGFPDDFAEYDTEQNINNEYINEAIAVFEKVIAMDGITSQQKTASIINLVTFYTATGQQQKAQALADKQVGIDGCREFVLMLATNGKEGSIVTCAVMIGILRYLKMNVIWAIGTKKSLRTSQYGLDVLESVINVYKTVIEDGNMGAMHSDISDLYASCAAVADRMCDIEKAKEYFGLAYFHRQEYDKVRSEKDFRYTSRLFSEVSFSGSVLPEYTMTSLKNQCANLSEELKQLIRNDERYAAAQNE